MAAMQTGPGRAGAIRLYGALQQGNAFAQIRAAAGSGSIPEEIGSVSFGRDARGFEDR
jgi:hypothetical protein